MVDFDSGALLIDSARRFATKRLLIGATVAGLVLAQSAVRADQAVAKFGAPRVLQLPESFPACRAEPVGAVRNEVFVAIDIAADGKPKEIRLADNSPAWVKELANCAVAQLQFAPGTWDDVPAESTAHVTFKLRTGGSGDPGFVEIDSMGPLITPPRLHPGRDRNDCFPEHLSGGVGRFVVTLTVMPDGSIVNVTLPTGSEPWVEKTAHCLLGRTTFTPGTDNGMPVQAQASLPIVYKSGEGEVKPPQLRSSNADIEAAYRACYPPDLVTFASAFYRFEISTSGRVSKPRLVKGSGDRRLDDAGICILPKLEFTPFIQDGRAIRANVTWELPMRPPR